MHALNVGLLLVAAAAYALGALRMWRRAGVGRGLSFVNVGCFLAGLGVLLFALLSPLHHLAAERLWAHMVQHELLMVLAAPLLIAGRPLVAVPVRVPKWLTGPVLAWMLHAAAIWLWHVPPFFAAAAENEALHFAQHASFLFTALLFWWSAGVLSLFTTMLHTGALGALMALSARSWYPGYALEDQQLAGLVMWIPAGLAYPAAALYLLSRTLRRQSTSPGATPPAYLCASDTRSL
jgi:putative membrane protein